MKSDYEKVIFGPWLLDYQGYYYRESLDGTVRYKLWLGWEIDMWHHTLSGAWYFKTSKEAMRDADSCLIRNKCKLVNSLDRFHALKILL